MEKQNLIGRQINGFKFESDPNFNSLSDGLKYYEEMDFFVGKIGTVLHQMKDVVIVEFIKENEYNFSWIYPIDKALEHLV